MTAWRDILDSRVREIPDDPTAELVAVGDAPRKQRRPRLRSRRNALTLELCRAFAGKKPGFEYISSSIGATGLATLHCGLFKKVIVSYAGESYPTPGPSRVVKRAIEDGLDVENWSMLTISQRLLGGAMGVPWFPTRSLAGSSIGEEQRERGNYMEVDDPDRPGETFGLLKSYRPDLSFLLAWAADRAGNAILYPPYGENVYGPLAARDGVILTADHIVGTEFLRPHAPLGRTRYPIG